MYSKSNSLSLSLSLLLQTTVQWHGVSLAISHLPDRTAFELQDLIKC